MSRIGWESILRKVRRIGTADSGGGISDAALLQRFTGQRDEAAFDALIARHGPMVWSVCRRLLPNLPDAEDAFQATFLVLVRKADVIRQPDLLGAWLYGVAYRIAARLRAVTAGRRQRECTAIDVAALETVPDAERNELRLLLDHEVSRLPRRYRLPFVLCHLEGMTNEEAARRLRCPKGTVLSRLSRARERLRKRLTRRGIGLSSAAVAAAIGESADAGSVPLALSAATGRLAPALLSGGASALPGSTAVALMEGMVTSMYVAKLKLAAVILLTLGLLGAGGGLLGRGGQAQTLASMTPPEPTPKKTFNLDAPAKKGAEVPPPALPQPAANNDLAIRDSLARTYKFDGFDDPKITLQDTLEALSQRYGIPFSVDERSFRNAANEPILHAKIAERPIPPQTATLDTILHRILERLPGDTPAATAVFLIRKGQVEILSKAAACRELQIDESMPFPALVYEHFEDVPLLQALNTVAKDADVNVVIDPAVAALVKDIKVSAPLHNVPAESAVFILAQMGDVGMVSYGNVLYVAPQKKAQFLEMRRQGLEPAEGSTEPKPKAK
jgi:RNA polymerase sigma factor (sigma-70 family)